MYSMNAIKANVEKQYIIWKRIIINLNNFVLHLWHSPAKVVEIVRTEVWNIHARVAINKEERRVSRCEKRLERRDR